MIADLSVASLTNRLSLIWKWASREKSSRKSKFWQIRDLQRRFRREMGLLKAHTCACDRLMSAEGTIVNLLNSCLASHQATDIIPISWKCLATSGGNNKKKVQVKKEPKTKNRLKKAIGDGIIIVSSFSFIGLYKKKVKGGQTRTITLLQAILDAQ